MKWQDIPLSALAEIKSGGGAPQAADAFSDDGHPFVRAGSLVKLLSGSLETELEKITPEVARANGLKLFPAGTVLFAKSGMSATKGYIYALRDEAYVVNHLAAIVPHTSSDSAFLSHALQLFSPTRLIKDPAYPSIRLGDIADMKIHAPRDTIERGRIAAILDAADALRRKRREALARIEVLTQAIFVEMFVQGNSGGWPVMSVADLALDLRTGPFGSQLLHSEFVDSGIAVLGIDNAVKNEFSWNERRYISIKKYNQLKKFTVRPGDVIITIMGTCGRCAIIPDDIPLAINTKHLCSITLNKTKILPEFLHATFLYNSKILERLGVQSRGAVMPGLNMGKIKSLSFPIPPLALQATFRDRVQTASSLRDCHLQGIAHLDTLFASLQHRAFRGEL